MEIYFRAPPRLNVFGFVAFQGSGLSWTWLSLTCTHLTTSTDNQCIFFLALLKRKTVCREKKPTKQTNQNACTQPGACCQSFLLLFYYTKIFWCHRPHTHTKKKSSFIHPWSPPQHRLLKTGVVHCSSLLYLKTRWVIIYIGKCFFHLPRRLSSIEVYTVRKWHGNAVPRRNRIAGLVSYNWKPECLSLWGLCTDEIINLSHVGEKKKSGLLLLRFLKI